MTFVRKATGSTAKAAWDVVFPPHCLVCGETDGLDPDGPHFCGGCLAEVERKADDVCRRCASPVVGAVAGAAGSVVEDGRCGECRARRLFFKRAVTINTYEGLNRKLVLKVKHANQEALTAAVGRLLGRTIARQGANAGVEAVTCIPLHWARRLIRGYHAPELLAAAVGRELNLPVNTDLLYCRRWAAKQSTLLPDERQKNVRGLFGVSRAFDLSGVKLLVVDDVMTTWATLSSAAKSLRRAGAAEVIVAAIAHG